MNKKAQGTILFALMLGVLFFLIGLALAPALNSIGSQASSSSELNCSATNITQQNKAVCTQIDMFQPLYVGLIFSLAGLIIGGIAIR